MSTSRRAPNRDLIRIDSKFLGIRSQPTNRLLAVMNLVWPLRLSAQTTDNTGLNEFSCWSQCRQTILTQTAALVSRLPTTPCIQTWSPNSDRRRFKVCLGLRVPAYFAFFCGEKMCSSKSSPVKMKFERNSSKTMLLLLFAVRKNKWQQLLYS